MLLITFRDGEIVYAIDARQVVEIVPRVTLRPIPHAPASILGLLNYRGAVVPVVDFRAVTGEARSRESLSTRIILTEFPGKGAVRHRLGIMAEEVDEVVRGEEGEVVLSAMSLDEAPYLGRVFRFGDRLIQLIKPERVLPDRVRAALFGEGAEVG